MKDREIDLCGAEGGGRAPDMPYLAAGDSFAFQCAGCGGCCRGREDLVLSGYDLYRLSRRLGLPPRITARAFCRSHIGAVSRLPVLRLAPVKTEGNNCPFLSGGRCAVHEARPLACALYPLGQEISRDGTVRYYFQKTSCGGKAFRATLADYLAAQGVAERERCDVLWATRCMELEQQAPGWEAALGPVILRRFQAKLADALYYRFDTVRPWAEQFCENLAWLAGERVRLEAMQQTLLSKKRMDAFKSINNGGTSDE